MVTVQAVARKSGASFTSGPAKQHVAFAHDATVHPAYARKRIERADPVDDGVILVRHIGAMLVIAGEGSARMAVLPDGFTAEDYVMVCRIDGCGRNDPSMEGLFPAAQIVAAALPEGPTMLIFLPRLAFKGIESRVDAIFRSEGGFKAGSLLLSYLGSLSRHLRAVTASDAPVIESVTVQLVRAAIVKMGDSGGGFASSANNSRLESARQFIDERLASPHLTVDSVKTCLGISRRQLYLLFEPYGGVARYIQERRLLKSREVLSCSCPKLPDRRIAEQCGLDPRRFERLFREAFGVSPGQIERCGVEQA